MNAAKRILYSPNGPRLPPWDNSGHPARGKYELQCKARVFRSLIVCDNVVEVENADKHLRSLGAEPEVLTCPIIPSSIKQELAGDGDRIWWIPQPIVVTREGFRNICSEFGDSQ